MQNFNCMLPSAFLYKLADLRGLEELVLRIEDRKVGLSLPAAKAEEAEPQT